MRRLHGTSFVCSSVYFDVLTVFAYNNLLIFAARVFAATSGSTVYSIVS